jgi:acetate kinase
MSDYILVLNAGSSSLKFRVYERSPPSWQAAASGQIEGIGTAARFTAKDGSGRELIDEAQPTVGDARGALTVVRNWLRARYAGGRVLAVGHRVVHGGARYTGPTRVTREVLEELRALEPLAPLHQPHNLAPIEVFLERSPAVPQVACFDTSFHRGHEAFVDLVPLPAELRERGVQRYGFHGLSYEYIAATMPQVAPESAAGRVIVAHLGSGASLCALKGGRSIDCTLGFTALDGLCMGTRPGSVDPGVILYLFQSLGLSSKEVESLLYKKSGLLGISGISNDMRDLLASDEPAARLAVEYFVYRAAK